MTNLTTIELEALRSSGVDFLLLDVNSKVCFDDDHIDGAQNVPGDSPEFAALVASVAGGKGRKIVVYCADRSCDAATQAAYQLAGTGYTDVVAYEGGLAAWRVRAGDEVAPTRAPANGIGSSCGPVSDTAAGSGTAVGRVRGSGFGHIG